MHIFSFKFEYMRSLKLLNSVTLKHGTGPGSSEMPCRSAVWGTNQTNSGSSVRRNYLVERLIKPK